MALFFTLRSVAFWALNFRYNVVVRVCSNVDNIAAKRFNMDVPGSGRSCIANVHVDYDFIKCLSIVIGSDYTTIVTLIEAEIRGSGQGCQFQYSILVYVR